MGVIRLNDGDWNVLMKTVPVSLGSTTIEIAPIGLPGMSALIENINSVFAAMVEKEITIANIEEHPIDLFQILAEKAPAFLEALTGVDRDDIARLPIAKGVELLRAVIEVNLVDPKAMAENIKAVMALVGKFDADSVLSVAQ